LAILFILVFRHALRKSRKRFHAQRLRIFFHKLRPNIDLKTPHVQEKKYKKIRNFLISQKGAKKKKPEELPQIINGTCTCGGYGRESPAQIQHVEPGVVAHVALGRLGSGRTLKGRGEREKRNPEKRRAATWGKKNKPQYQRHNAETRSSREIRPN
jgi:hypothetical protein